MNPNLCKYCNQPVNRKKPGIQCGSFCAKFVHGECVNIVGRNLDTIRMKGVRWDCEECRSISANTSTAVRTRTSIGVSSADMPILSAPSTDVMEAVRAMQEQLRQIQEQQSALLESVNFCSAKITDFEQKLSRFDDYVKKVDKIVAENKKLTDNVISLEHKVNDLEQTSRSQNIEIQGIPEKNNENIEDILQKIGTYINYDITPEKIEYARRVQLNKNNQNKIKNIIVRFTSVKEKEGVLLAAKAKRLQRVNGSPKMKIEGLSENLYINEHLTLNNKILYKELRNAAKAKNYKFCWTKNGAIFVRKSDSSKILLIKNQESIKNM